MLKGDVPRGTLTYNIELYARTTTTRNQPDTR